MPPKRPPAGVEFPVDAKGKRSTTDINNGAFAAAARATDAKTAALVEKDKRKWRFKYAKHVVSHVENCALSAEGTLRMAEAGLDYLHEQMRFVRGEEETSLRAAMAKHTACDGWSTGRLEGSLERPATPDVYLHHVPFDAPTKGAELRGAELRVQVDKWVRAGVMEVDAGAALLRAVEQPSSLDLSKTWFVLFGATSAMGPFELLMRMGATVVAIDLDRKPIWQRILKRARASPATLLFPVRGGRTQDEFGSDDGALAEHCGANLLEHTPEIRNWLRTLRPPAGTQVVFGNYAYLDGPLFVKLAMAMDAIGREFTESAAWPGCPKAALAYLCTPTDAHVCPPEARAAAAAQLRRAPAWQQLLAPLTGAAAKRNARRPVPTEGGGELCVVDAIVPQQGPNYILAKRLQHWRGMVAAHRHGCLVSSNVAPSTATASVLSNFSFKVAYGGMHLYRPIEVFMQETSNSVMGLLLLHDVLVPGSAAHVHAAAAAGGGGAPPHPLTLFSKGSVHGGAWRCAWRFGVLGTGAVIGYVVGTLLASAYLMLYNAGMVAGYVGVARALVVGGGGGGVLGALTGSFRGTVAVMQCLSVLEVIHAALGLVRAPVGTTALQVYSRVMLAAVADAAFAGAAQPASLGATPWVLLFSTMWTMTEIVRYSFYACNIVGVSIKPLTWLRYSLFLTNYPLGVLGEIGTLWSLRSFYATVSAPGYTSSASGWTGAIFSAAYKWCWAPFMTASGGSANVLFGLLMLQYVIGFPKLFKLMLSQRKKVLGGGKKATRTTSEIDRD
eukprot:g1177.t1